MLSHPIDNHALTGNIKIECEYLKAFLFTAFNDTPEEERFADILNWYRVAIIRLSNSLFNETGTNSVVTKALHTLIGLLRYMEQEYGLLLDRNHPLPAFEVLELHRRLTGECREIADMLRQKNVSETLLKQLVKAFEDPFKPQRYPELCYREKYYLEMFIQRLKMLALDDREKDWNMRLRQMLLKYNFNHMGVYKVLAKEILIEFDALREWEKQHEFLHEKELLLQNKQEEPGFAYHTIFDSLKCILLKDVRIMQNHLMQKMQLKMLDDYRRVGFSISVAELNIEFHYDYEEGIFNYSSKIEAAEVVSKVIQTKDTKIVSPHSLKKVDKTRSLGAALNVYRRYIRKANKLVKDYNLKIDLND